MNRRTWVILATLVLIAGALCLVFFSRDQLSPPPPVVAPDDLDQLEPQAKAYVSRFLEAARSAPGDARRRAQLGLVLVANRFVPEAYVEFKAAVRLDPAQLMGHHYMGLTKQALGDAVSALTHFRDVTVKFPDFAPAHHSCGELLLNFGRTEEARAAFRRAIALAPSESSGYVGLAHTLIVERKFGDAGEVLDKALGYQPNHPRARYLRGLAYRGLGKREEAARELKLGLADQKYSMPDPWTKELRKHDKSASRTISLVKTYSAAGRHEQAKTIVEEALKWNPKRANLLLAASSVYLNLKKPGEALSFARRALKVDDTRFATYIKVALCHDALGNLEETLEFSRRAVDVAPQSSRARHFRADMLRNSRKFVEALASLKEAARLDPGNSSIFTDTGIVLLQLDRIQEARQELETAVELDDDNILACLYLSSICIGLEQWDDARTLLNAAKKRAPEDSRVDKVMAQLPRD